jgi:hypothetical protein
LEFVLDPIEIWILTEREAVAAHIAEGFAQAERDELIDAEEAVRVLRERRMAPNAPESRQNPPDR